MLERVKVCVYGARRHAMNTSNQSRSYRVLQLVSCRVLANHSGKYYSVHSHTYSLTHSLTYLLTHSLRNIVSETKRVGVIAVVLQRLSALRDLLERVMDAVITVFSELYDQLINI